MVKLYYLKDIERIQEKLGYCNTSTPMIWFLLFIVIGIGMVVIGALSEVWSMFVVQSTNPVDTVLTYNIWKQCTETKLKAILVFLHLGALLCFAGITFVNITLLIVWHYHGEDSPGIRVVRIITGSIGLLASFTTLFAFAGVVHQQLADTFLNETEHGINLQTASEIRMHSTYELGIASYLMVGQIISGFISAFGSLCTTFCWTKSSDLKPGYIRNALKYHLLKLDSIYQSDIEGYEEFNCYENSNGKNAQIITSIQMEAEETK